MAQEVEKSVVNGNGLELEADWERNVGNGIVGFLAQHASRYPWFFGIASITVITVYPESSPNDLVQLSGNICVAVITIISTLARRDNEQKGTAQLSSVATDTG